MCSRPDLVRLGLALLASLLLHGALLLGGARQEPGGPAAPARAGPAGVLNAALRPSTEARSSAPAPIEPPSVPGAADTPPPPKPPGPTPDARGYFPAAQLSHPPRPLGEIKLDLPEAALLTAAGRLGLTLWIDTEGRVVAYHIEAPDLPEEYATAVAEVFAATRYAPGELQGRKVGSVLKVEIEHRPSEPGQR